MPLFVVLRPGVDLTTLCERIAVAPSARPCRPASLCPTRSLQVAEIPAHAQPAKSSEPPIRSCRRPAAGQGGQQGRTMAASPGCLDWCWRACREYRPGQKQATDVLTRQAGVRGLGWLHSATAITVPRRGISAPKAGRQLFAPGRAALSDRPGRLVASQRRHRCRPLGHAARRGQMAIGDVSSFHAEASAAPCPTAAWSRSLRRRARSISVPSRNTVRKPAGVLSWLALRDQEQALWPTDPRPGGTA